MLTKEQNNLTIVVVHQSQRNLNTTHNPTKDEATSNARV
jgi:hypothetical protein